MFLLSLKCRIMSWQNRFAKTVYRTNRPGYHNSTCSCGWAMLPNIAANSPCKVFSANKSFWDVIKTKTSGLFRINPAPIRSRYELMTTDGYRLWLLNFQLRLPISRYFIELISGFPLLFPKATSSSNGVTRGLAYFTESINSNSWTSGINKCVNWIEVNQLWANVFQGKQIPFLAMFASVRFNLS